MLEFIFDRHNDNVFNKKVCPVYSMGNCRNYSFGDYENEALKLIENHHSDRIVIIHGNPLDFSINDFALALFIQSYHLDDTLDAIVFQVDDVSRAISEYTPIIALSIGIKYIIRLYAEEPKIIYKEIALLNYLDMTIKEDFINNKIIIERDGSGPEHTVHALTTDDALITIGLMKALSLAHVDKHIKADFLISDQKPQQSESDIVHKIISLWNTETALSQSVDTAISC